MFSFLVIISVVSAVLGAPLDSSHLCSDVLQLDCSVNYIQEETDERVCGNDGVTYDNLCHYSQARCKNTHMHLSGIGPCGGGPALTSAPATVAMTTGGVMVTSGTTPGATAAPTTTTPPGTTVDHLLQVFCSSKDTLTCNTDLDPICGSDKNFYLNKCEFSKAKCDDPTMDIRDISWCTGA